MRASPNRPRLSLLLAGMALSAVSHAASLPDAAEVGAYARQLLAEQQIDPQGPGLALLVARGDQLLYKGAVGRASIELGVPLQPDQLFRIGSVTKQFAAAGLLKLIDEGRASLDDPLSKYLPTFPKGEGITLAQLLNHSSGVRSYTGIPGYMNNLVRRELSTAALIDEFKNQPTDFAPGTGWAYNNSGYVLVGAVIEAISGKPWHAYLDEVLLKPAQLSRTFYPGEHRVLPGMVQGYSLMPGQPVQGAGFVSMTQPHAAGALVSSVEDLWRWNRLLHGGALLKPASYQRMITPEGAAAKGSMRYGFGIVSEQLRGQPWLQHGGGIHGFVSLLSYQPQSQVTVAVLRNSDGRGPNLELISRKLAAYAGGNPYPASQPVPVPLEQLKALEGVFQKEGGKAEETRSLRVRDGKLFSTRAGGQPMALEPQAGGAFAFANSLSRMDVERDDQGRPVALKTYQDGDGIFERWLRSADLPVEVSIGLDIAQQQALVGDYASERLQLKVLRDEASGQLKVQVQRQPAFVLKARSPRSLYLTDVDARLDFEPAEGPVTQLILTQGPGRFVLLRR